jgi:hypothetical protein
MKIFLVDSSLPVNIQLLLMLLLVSSLVGFVVGCFCLTRGDKHKTPQKMIQTSWGDGKLEPIDENVQTNV